MSANISLYPHIKEAKISQDIPVDLFLEDIRSGKWQDPVLEIHRIADKDARAEAKKKLPYVTVSGRFSERKNSGLLEHSGLICIDLDKIDPNFVKSILCPDKHVYACFTSASGTGLAVLFKIKADRHLEAFEGLQEYLYTKYQLSVDDHCKDVSRARFVSFDPGIYINEAADKFTLYPKKEPRAATKVPDVIFVQSDFDTIVNELTSRRIDITGNYRQWLKIGFALVDKLGEGGRQHFHALSQYSHLYKYEPADRQYTNCLKANKSGITIASFYYLAKQAGINTMSERTAMIAKAAYSQKRAGIPREGVVKGLQQFENIPAEESLPVIDQVYDNNIQVAEAKLIDTVEAWLSERHEFRRNLITDRVEIDGREIVDTDTRELWRQCAKVMDKVSKEMIKDIVGSRFCIEYNPFADFFAKYKDRRPQGVIRKFFSCISTDTGGLYEGYTYDYGVRWLVGIVQSMQGGFSPLMLILIGAKNAGKSYFFYHLLPDELQRYMTKIDQNAFVTPSGQRDLQLRACDHLLLLDDEMPDKGKRDQEFVKQLLGSEKVTTRRAYGEFDVSLKRIAVYAGTSNKPEVLFDETGNRRQIPINLTAPIDRAIYNSVDKIDLLIEAYHLYHEGGIRPELSDIEIETLNINTTEFQATSMEEELLDKYFELFEEQPDKNWVKLTLTDMYIHIQERNQAYNLDKVMFKRAVNKKGWKPSANTKIGGRDGRFYKLIDKTPHTVPGGTF